MKRFLFAALLCLSGIMLSGCSSRADDGVITMNISPRDMELAELYFGGYFSAPGELPFSYTYGGAEYRGMPEGSIIFGEDISGDIERTVFRGEIDGELEIKAECIIYRNYPAVEWTVYFTGIGDGNTKILEDVSAIDTRFDGAAPVLVHNNGDFNSPDGYAVSYLKLSDGVSFSQSPDGGRSCDGAFPYQRLLFDGFGMNISIGWPGQWTCDYKGLPDGVSFSAGQETVHTYLKPGETLRTPRMTLMMFGGDETRGINVWRRWFNAHVTPRTDGEITKPYLVMSDNNGGVEFTAATGENQLNAIKYVADSGTAANLWWIDAGWYPCRDGDGISDWWRYIGNWHPDPERFPDGFAPIGKAADDAGMELLVWFEPERTNFKTYVGREYPYWMLDDGRDDDYRKTYLLDLSNPDCVEWLGRTISDFLAENGITVYRQDFNVEPLDYWRYNEDGDRMGMRENQYIQGYLAYWDYLLENVPGLTIDSCASGGRRNDLETMSRAVAFHPTDYGYGYHHINQGFRHTLNAWFTYGRGWAQSWDEGNEYYDHDDYYAADEPIPFDRFKIINGFGALSFFGGRDYLQSLCPDDPDYPEKIWEMWERFARLQINGDFYALTPNHRDNAKWTVFQFDLPESNEGTFQVLRNNQAKDETLTVYPYGFGKNADYTFNNIETGESYTVSGKAVNEKGITFTQPLRSGAVWFYEGVE